jgi:hypothetical protein
MTYESIDRWVKKYVNTGEYKSVKYIKEKIDDADSEKKITSWINNKGYNAKGNKAYEDIIEKPIERDNKSYTKDIKSDIESAQDLDDLSKIKLDKDYEILSNDGLETAIKEKENELSGDTKILDDIRSARPTKKHPIPLEYEEVSKIKDKNIRSKAEEIIKDTEREVESETDIIQNRLLEKIRNSTNPQSIDVSQAKTIPSEELLIQAIANRQKQLDEEQANE